MSQFDHKLVEDLKKDITNIFKIASQTVMKHGCILSAFKISRQNIRLQASETPETPKNTNHLTDEILNVCKSVHNIIIILQKIETKLKQLMMTNSETITMDYVDTLNILLIDSINHMFDEQEEKYQKNIEMLFNSLTPLEDALQRAEKNKTYLNLISQLLISYDPMEEIIKLSRNELQNKLYSASIKWAHEEAERENHDNLVKKGIESVNNTTFLRAEIHNMCEQLASADSGYSIYAQMSKAIINVHIMPNLSGLNIEDINSDEETSPEDWMKPDEYLTDEEGWLTDNHKFKPSILLTDEEMSTSYEEYKTKRLMDEEANHLDFVERECDVRTYHCNNSLDVCKAAPNENSISGDMKYLCANYAVNKARERVNQQLIDTKKVIDIAIKSLKDNCNTVPVKCEPDKTTKETLFLAHVMNCLMKDNSI